MSFNVNEKALLTIKEFCFLCNIGYTKYREEVLAERIKTIPIGLRGVRIHRDEVVNWPKRCRGEAIFGEK
jgi:hypothetical protein